MNQTGKAVGPRPVSGRTNPLPILQVTTGFWASQALMTAVELRIFTVLFGGPKTAADVATEVGADPVALEALLDANCALGFLHRQGDRYRNDDVSNQFLVEGSPGSYVDLVRCMRDPLYHLWENLSDTVRTGKASASAEGKTELATARAYHNGYYATMMRVAEILDLEYSAYGRILDLGSHTGAGALCLARRYPHFQATIQDRALFQPLAEEFIRTLKLDDRVRFAPGDPDHAQPDGNYDLVLLPHFLSQRGRDAIPGILANVVASLRKGGTVLVTEFVLEESRAEPKEAALFRLNVLAAHGSAAAGALTRAELVRFLQDAGLTDVDMVGLPMFGITAITACKS